MELVWLSPRKNLPPFFYLKQKILFAIFDFAMCEMISQAKRPRPQSSRPVFQHTHTEIRCNISMASSPEENKKKMKQRIRKATNFDRKIPPPLASRKFPKKNGKYIRNKNKKKLLPHTRDNRRGLPFFFSKLKN